MPFTGVRHSTNGHRAVFHRILPQQCCIGAHALARWTHSVFCAFTFPTLVLFHQRLLDRMAYALHWCPAFNQWSPCSVSPHSAPAVLYRCPCPSPVDAQRLLLLRRFLRWLSSTSGCLIEWLMPFASVLHSTDGHRAVLHCFLPWQCLVDTSVLVWWMHSVFRSLGVSYAGSPPSAIAGSNGLHPSLVSGIQPMVTVQCFTAF